MLLLLLFACLSFLFCCFYCSNHDAVVAIVLHFRFLLLLLLFAKQPIKSERYRTLHLPSLLLSSLSLSQYCCCCCSSFPILMILFLLLFTTKKKRYNLTIPSIAYPFVVTIIMTNIINNIFFRTYFLSMMTNPIGSLALLIAISATGTTILHYCQIPIKPSQQFFLQNK